MSGPTPDRHGNSPEDALQGRAHSACGLRELEIVPLSVAVVANTDDNHHESDGLFTNVLPIDQFPDKPPPRPEHFALRHLQSLSLPLSPSSGGSRSSLPHIPIPVTADFVEQLRQLLNNRENMLLK